MYYDFIEKEKSEKLYRFFLFYIAFDISSVLPAASLIIWVMWVDRWLYGVVF